MKKLFVVFLTITAMVGCSSLGTTSCPLIPILIALMKKAVKYMRNVPTLNLHGLPSQKKRSNQDLVDHEIMFAVSGGGARAAAFALGVMAELETLGLWTSTTVNINALSEVDYFTTVSGGGWGVSAYLSDRNSSKVSSYKLSDRLPSIQQNFLNFSSGKISCLSNELNKNISNGMTFGDIFKKDEIPSLPYLFSVGTLLPSQSPFVFTSEFLDYYKVDHLYACGTDVDIDVSKGFENIDVAYAIATSGSVPAFYHSSATTKICEEDSDLFDSYFCSRGLVDFSKMILADGGVYDNYGYLTAIEALNTLDSSKETKKVLIIIDANADTESHFVNEISHNSIGIGKETLLTLGFPARTTTFNRLRKPLLDAMDIDSLVIDFFSTSDFTEKTKSMSDKKLLNGLDSLKEHAANNVSCFAEDGRYLKAVTDWKDKMLFKNPKIETQEERSISSDCIANNFYRSGLMNKTTYLNDEHYFAVLTQLGRLAVRMNADAIYGKIYGK